MKGRRYVLWGITVMFFVIMLVLTAAAREIHNAFIPHVAVENPIRRVFIFKYKDEEGNAGEISQKRLSISKTLAQQPVFIVYEGVKNGEVRTFVQEIFVETGMENDGFIEVVSGLSEKDKLVVSADKALWDGAEVYVEE